MYTMTRLLVRIAEPYSLAVGQHVVHATLRSALTSRSFIRQHLHHSTLTAADASQVTSLMRIFRLESVTGANDLQFYRSLWE